MQSPAPLGRWMRSGSPLFAQRSADSINTRLLLLDYCVRHQLDQSTVEVLWRLAGVDVPPRSLSPRDRIGLAAISALLLGAGLVCWIAANWSGLSKTLQFGMLEALVLLPCVGAAILPKLRSGLAMFAFISIGALFAYYGQTYQTGADMWQLFALWSALGLPLVITVRAEALRVAWIIVAMTAIGLWTNNSEGLFHHVAAAPALTGSVAALVLALLLSRPLRRFTAAGAYSSGAAVAAALVITCMTALPGILGSGDKGTATLLVADFSRCHLLRTSRVIRHRCALCMCPGLNFLLDTAVVMATFSGPTRDIFGSVFIIGIAACSLCGASIAAILSVMRSQLGHGGCHE